MVMVNILRRTHCRRSGKLIKEEIAGEMETNLSVEMALNNHCRLITGKNLQEVVDEITQSGRHYVQLNQGEGEDDDGL